MEIIIYKSHVKELGGAAVDSSNAATTYSYIELKDGQFLKSVGVSYGLNGVLQLAFEEGEEVELHVYKSSLLSDNDNSLVLVAIKRASDKIFAFKMPISNISIPIKIGMYLLYALGIFTIPFLGIGLILIWFGWKLRPIVKLTDELKKIKIYVDNLKDAIVI